MGHKSTFRAGWFVLALLLAAANIVHALYFDWSDLGMRSVVAVLCLLVAIRWQRTAAAAAGFFVLLVGLAFASSTRPDWTMEARAGERWARVQQALGTPTYQAASLEQARKLDFGYSVPSPLRYRHSGPVAIYVRGDHALWVLHDDDIVKGTFVGGS